MKTVLAVIMWGLWLMSMVLAVLFIDGRTSAVWLILSGIFTFVGMSVYVLFVEDEK